MHTVRLKVNDSVYDKLLGLLSKCNKDEVEIISETFDFKQNQSYFSNELDEILTTKARFIEVEEAEQRLENIIKKHKSSI
jgi:hypothetical protein